MTKIESLMQVKAFARQDGASLSLLWIASFACVLGMPQSMIGSLLALATPFFIGWRLCKFRDYALDGVLSFRRGYVYSTYTFFYAAVIFALAQYVYFRFLDHGTFCTMITDSINAMMPLYENSGISKKELTESLSIISSSTPVQWAFTFMMQNICTGVIASLPIAAVCARRSRGTTIGRSSSQN